VWRDVIAQEESGGGEKFTGSSLHKPGYCKARQTVRGLANAGEGEPELIDLSIAPSACDLFAQGKTDAPKTKKRDIKVRAMAHEDG